MFEWRVFRYRKLKIRLFLLLLLGSGGGEGYIGQDMFVYILYTLGEEK